MERHEAELLTRQGMGALRQGDAASAHVCFSQIVADPPVGTLPPWLLLSQACRALGDLAGQEAALKALLDAEPRNLAALLLMASLQADRKDTRAATAFYITALNVADQTGAPQNLAPLLEQGQRFLQQTNFDYSRFLDERLADAGIRPGAISARIDAALDLLAGRTQVFLQQPTSFYFPGLPQRQFYESHEFAWGEQFEAEAAPMTAELIALLDRQQAPFAPYLRSDASRPSSANPLRDDPSWGAHYLWENGVPVADHAAQAPVTMRALALAPMPVIEQRSPMALYSLLRPATHIKPHHGMLNTRLICHMPLITNPDCAIRVGNETRSWQHGKLLIFDDSFEHEAWNKGDATRIILLFEIWRPEISMDERRALTTIFQAINAYGGLPRD